MSEPTLQDVLAYAQAWAAKQGIMLIGVKFVQANGQELPFQITTQATPKATKRSVFVPHARQRAILDALDRRAMRTDELAAASKVDRRSLFKKPGGIEELIELGLLEHHKELGYYRPDSPPEELAGED